MGGECTKVKWREKEKRAWKEKIAWRIEKIKRT